MSQKEIIHLVGDFHPSVLERWALFAKLTNRTIKHTSMDELGTTYQGTSPIMILDDHALNDLPLPGDAP